MKFLVVAPRFHTNLYYRVLALQNAGNKVKVLVLYKGKSEHYDNIDIEELKLSFFSKTLISVFKLFKNKLLKSAFELRVQSPNRKLSKEIRKFKPDTIILKAYQNMLALKALFIARRFRIKVLMLTQTTFTHIKGSKLLFHLNIKLFNYLGVHAYITPIKLNYEAFKNFGIKNVFYLPFVFPATDFIKKESEKERKEIKIFSVGKFVKRKDHILLIKACHYLITQNYKVKLTIYGEKADEKYFDELENYIMNNKLSQNIVILTNIPYTQLLTEYQKHDIFVLPAYKEPAAYSPVEAMVNGLPVIVSSECGTKCYIEEGVNGYVFEAKSLSSLINKIKKLIDNKTELKSVAENALNRVHQNHNSVFFAEQIVEIIK